MMPFKTIMKTLTYSLVLLLMACNNPEPCDECMEDQKRLEAEKEMAPEVKEQESIEKEPDPIVKTEGVDKDYVENKAKIEEKFGEQWDFCKCIKANDSINQAVFNGADIDEAFENRMNEIESKCKAFLVMSSNTTPDERALHQQKVEDCLKK